MITLEEAIDARIRLALRAERERVVSDLREAANRKFDHDSGENAESEVLDLIADVLAGE